jgi:UPF0755 protein
MSKRLVYITGIVLISIAAVIAAVAVGYHFAFAAPQKQAESEQFTVPLPADRNGAILIDFTLAGELKNRGFIRNEWGFEFALGKAKVEPGAYKLSKSMNAWQIVNALKAPYMKWVVIPEGLRKEQIAGILAKELHWDDAKKNNWITLDTAQKFDYVEGVYFPDTYLIPVAESGPDVAQRLINKFNEKFAPYAAEATQQNIKWDTALKIASLVQREAGGKDDMSLIAGVIWNRLLVKMSLDIDATLQYAKGSEENGWWGKVTPADKEIDSPYNTYRRQGLPPHPIANPGLDAINAVLHPTETSCLYYLHDSNKQIHCAVTYEEHKENIDKYLR